MEAIIKRAVTFGTLRGMVLALFLTALIYQLLNGFSWVGAFSLAFDLFLLAAVQLAIWHIISLARQTR